MESFAFVVFVLQRRRSRPAAERVFAPPRSLPSMISAARYFSTTLCSVLLWFSPCCADSFHQHAWRLIGLCAPCLAFRSRLLANDPKAAAAFFFAVRRTNRRPVARSLSSSHSCLKCSRASYRRCPRIVSDLPRHRLSHFHVIALVHFRARLAAGLCQSMPHSAFRGPSRKLSQPLCRRFSHSIALAFDRSRADIFRPIPTGRCLRSFGHA